MAVAHRRGWLGWRVKLGIRTRPKSVAHINSGLDQPTYACIVQLETVQLKIDQLKYVQLQHCLIGFLFNSPKCSVSFWASGFWPIYCLFKNITCSVGYLFDRPVTKILRDKTIRVGNKLGRALFARTPHRPHDFHRPMPY